MPTNLQYSIYRTNDFRVCKLANASLCCSCKMDFVILLFKKRKSAVLHDRFNGMEQVINTWIIGITQVLHVFDML